MIEYINDDLVKEYWTPKLSNKYLNDIALARSLKRITANKGYRDSVLYGIKDKDTVIKVNGEVQNNTDGILYSMTSECSFTGSFEVEIQGPVEILSMNSIAYYPGFYKGGFRELPIRQDVYCKWMDPGNYGKNDSLVFQHHILAGPTFADLDNNTEVYEYDTDIKIEPYNYELNMQKLQ
jgi:hypothetical protein